MKTTGDEGSVHGVIEERSDDGDIIKVYVDCIVGSEKEAIIGGVLTADPKNFLKGKPHESRGYVHVFERSGMDETDSVSSVLLVEKANSHCIDLVVKDFDSLTNTIGAHVNLCSKKDVKWEGCIANVLGHTVSHEPVYCE